ncbi:MAG: hypothetical protein HN341_13425 [Verrucomicrobia bacterium]|nr:hypothetical protein [Verrucomicrobiota bacterium]
MHIELKACSREIYERLGEGCDASELQTELDQLVFAAFGVVGCEGSLGTAAAPALRSATG